MKYHVNKVYEHMINRNLDMDLRITWLRFIDGADVEYFDQLLVLSAVANIILNNRRKPKDHIYFIFSSPDEIIKLFLSQHYLLDHTPR